MLSKVAKALLPTIFLPHLNNSEPQSVMFLIWLKHDIAPLRNARLTTIDRHCFFNVLEGIE
jgi:hypothetical protein